MNEKETDSDKPNPKPDRRARAQTQAIPNPKESRTLNRTRGSEILDPQQMEKYISLLNFKNKESNELLKVSLLPPSLSASSALTFIDRA